jgi:hypothetical protein
MPYQRDLHPSMNRAARVDPTSLFVDAVYDEMIMKVILSQVTLYLHGGFH